MGRPQFAQAGTAGGGQTVAVTERPEISVIDIGSTTDIASGGGETIRVYAPTGSVYRAIALRRAMPSNGAATSGTHQFQMFYENPNGTSPDLLFGESTYNTNLVFDGSAWRTADSRQEGDQRSVRALRATENEGMSFYYGNDTDATQTSDVNGAIVVEEVNY